MRFGDVGFRRMGHIFEQSRLPRLSLCAVVEIEEGLFPEKFGELLYVHAVQSYDNNRRISLHGTSVQRHIELSLTKLALHVVCRQDDHHLSARVYTLGHVFYDGLAQLKISAMDAIFEVVIVKEWNHVVVDPA